MSESGTLEFKLFVHADSRLGSQAVARTRLLLEQALSGRYELEVVDVFSDFEATRAWKVMATPCLIKVSPAPIRKIVGTLSDAESLRLFLNMTEISNVQQQH